MANGDLFDIRSEFWKEEFSKAFSYAEFLTQADKVHRQRWEEYGKRVVLRAGEEKLVQSFKRSMHVLVVVGAWCGDCARQGPMIDAIARQNSRLSVRFIDNQASSILRDELRIHGASRVPVAVFLSEDWFEIGRFGDRTLSAYRRKAANEVGDACDSGIVPPSEDQLATELREWIEIFERYQLMLRVSPFLRRRHGD